MKELLVTRGLGLEIDRKNIIRDVDTSLAVGEIKGVMGPNGAGKSTFLRLLAGELCPTSGEIALRGEDMTSKPAREFNKSGISYVSQRPGPFPDLTVEENVRGAVQRGSLFSRRSVRSKVDTLVDLIGMQAKLGLSARELSYGEMRTLDVGMALASEPVLLLADEPTAGVSGDVADEIITLLKGLCRSNDGRRFGLDGLIFVEHDKGTVFHLADRVGFLREGRFVVEGSPEEVHENRAVVQYLAEHGVD
ncbi:MAG: ATP-binding cassette domain-containing protein [Candidatus Bipolaricaulota bacterium]